MVVLQFELHYFLALVGYHEWIPNDQISSLRKVSVSKRMDIQTGKHANQPIGSKGSVAFLIKFGLPKKRED